MSNETEVNTIQKAATKAVKAVKSASKKVAVAKATKAPAAKKVAKAAVKQVGPSKEETKTGVHTFPDPEGGWANKRNGRLASKHPSKGEAVTAGREMAKKAKLEHTVHNANGQIASKNSYGADSPKVKG